MACKPKVPVLNVQSGIGRYHPNQRSSKCKKVHKASLMLHRINPVPVSILLLSKVKKEVVYMEGREESKETRQSLHI